MKKVDKELFKKIATILGPVGTSIVVLTHHNPDGDAVGSAIGLANLLANRGHKTSIVFPNDFPAYYNWIVVKGELLFYNRQKGKVKKAFNDCEILICVDFNTISRAGKVEKYIQNFKGSTILIDHHPDPENFCNCTVSDVTYSSTAELIFDFITELGLKKFMDISVAECLYTGIMTDTGSFSHNISEPNTYKVVAELLLQGIDAEKIHSNVYHKFSPDRMRFLGYCLHEKMELLPEFRTAIISITRDELKKFNFVPGDTEGFVNYPLSVAGIVFSALFIEKDDHVKISFRSKGAFPVNHFSSNHFSGGGHRNAAGGEEYANLENTLAKFRQLLPEYLHQLVNAEN